MLSLSRNNKFNGIAVSDSQLNLSKGRSVFTAILHKFSVTVNQNCAKSQAQFYIISYKDLLTSFLLYYYIVFLSYNLCTFALAFIKITWIILQTLHSCGVQNNYNFYDYFAYVSQYTHLSRGETPLLEKKEDVSALEKLCYSIGLFVLYLVGKWLYWLYKKIINYFFPPDDGKRPPGGKKPQGRKKPPAGKRFDIKDLPLVEPKVVLGFQPTKTEMIAKCVEVLKFLNSHPKTALISFGAFLEYFQGNYYPVAESIMQCLQMTFANPEWRHRIDIDYGVGLLEELDASIQRDKLRLSYLNDMKGETIKVYSSTSLYVPAGVLIMALKIAVNIYLRDPASL